MLNFGTLGQILVSINLSNLLRIFLFYLYLSFSTNSIFFRQKIEIDETILLFIKLILKQFSTELHKAVFFKTHIDLYWNCLFYPIAWSMFFSFVGHRFCCCYYFNSKEVNILFRGRNSRGIIIFLLLFF